MGYSIIRQIVSTISLSTFSFGIVFNCFLTRLILHRTPKPMQIYSRILIQTCITDMLLLTAVLLSETIIFFTAKGGNGRWLNGLVQIQNPDYRIFGFMAYIGYVFLVYVSLFNYVVQFIYRYLVLNRSKTISLRKYFGMFIGMLIIPLIYCISLGWLSYPVDGKEYLDDPAVAKILDLNISHKILLAASMTNNEIGLMISLTNYYIIFACTLAYSLICLLGWRMHKFIKNRGDSGGIGNPARNWRQQEKINEMNRQITKNLLIQACLPLTIYIPLLFILFVQLFGINVKMFSWIQYYYMLSIDPMWFPPALNPIVTILTIRPYRKAFIRSIQMFTQLFCCNFPSSSSTAGEGWTAFSISNNINNNNNNKMITQRTMNAWTSP